MDKKWIPLAFIFALVCLISNVNAATFEFNGTTYDINKTALGGTNVSVTLRDDSWNALNTSSVLSNATTGWFNMSLTLSNDWFYELSIIHNDSSGVVDYVGQSLPAFPYRDFSMLNNVNFYLVDAGTINITVINGTNNVTNFEYQVKDQKLGFPVKGCTSNSAGTETICKIPRDRNYSIMVMPAQQAQTQFVPVSYDWNNFTAIEDYNIDSISSYNFTKKTVNKQFNITESYARISGYLNATLMFNISISSWDEFIVVPFLSEPGDMIFMTYGTMPFNASVICPLLYDTDVYNNATGFYNITLPYAEQETVKYILFAAAKNGSTYYGGYRNITLTGDKEINFTMYGMLGDDSFINQSSFNDGYNVVNTSRQTFQLVNSTNHTISNAESFIEITVDYSSYGAIEFTFLEDLAAPNNGNFSLPLLNVTGIKEMNVYDMQNAPKRVSKKTPAQIIANNTIVLSAFNPKALDGTTGAQISIALYQSNSTCDVPNPIVGCNLTVPGTMDAFAMFPVVMGGGKISFRMGMGEVLVHYVDVDMLASGPPDALFEDDNDVTEGTTGAFNKAMKFGSNGPTIYDYVLISLPYTQGVSGSQTGLDESAEVNVSIPTFYDEDWSVVWNTSLNGTNATFLAGNHSHYSTYQSEWETLMGNNTCIVTTTGTSEINSSHPCHIDTTNDRIWIRLPHFSGTGPDVDGDVITYTPATTTTPSGNGGGGGGGGGTAANKTHKKTQYWTKITPGAATIMKITNPEIGLKQINITVVNPAQTVKITVTKLDGKPATIVHEIIGKVYKYMEIAADNINETHIDKVKIQFEVNKSWINDNNIDPDTVALNRHRVNAWERLQTRKTGENNDFVYYEAETPGFSTFAISGEVKAGVTTTTPGVTTTTPGVTTTTPIKEAEIGVSVWIAVVFIIVIVGIIGFALYKKRLVL